MRVYLTARELAAAAGVSEDMARSLIVANRGTEHVTRVRRPIGNGAMREVDAWVYDAPEPAADATQPRAA